MQLQKIAAMAFATLLLAGCGQAAGNAGATSANTSTESVSEKAAEKTKSAGQYISYEDYQKDKDTLGDRIVYYFNAPWCPSCQVMNQALLDNEETIPDGVSIVSVDFDTYTDLRKDLGVTMQDTFVELDDTGKVKMMFAAPVIDDLWKALEA